MLAAALLGCVLLVAIGAQASSASEPAVRHGDLLLIWGRLRDCPDRLRLLEVIRLNEDPMQLLDLGKFTVIGERSAEIARDLRARFQARTGRREAPPLEVEALPGEGVDALREVILLKQSISDLECEGFTPNPTHRPDHRPNPLFERIASR